MLIQLYLAVILAGVVQGKSKPVSVTLEAQWKSTPFLLEASEYVAKEKSTLFWAFVDQVVQSDYKASDDEELSYEEAVKVSSSLLNPSQLRLLKFSLALRENSALVNVHNQLGGEHVVPTHCKDSFADIHGKLTCDPTSVADLAKNALTRDSPRLYEFDHVFPVAEVGHSDLDSRATVVLYTELGSSDTKRWHQVLQALSDDDKITYVFRHYVRMESATPLLLSGYGVELAIKSTEYKAQDDTKVDEGKLEEEEEDVEIEGFDFKKLKSLHADLSSELNQFKHHLTATRQELTPLKVWQLQDLGFQTAEQVMSQADAQSSLIALRDLSSTLPVVQSNIVKTKVNSTRRAEILRNQQVFERYRIEPGDSSLLINGLQIDVDSSDIFSLMQTVREELNTLEALNSLGLKKHQATELLMLDMDTKSSSYAIDIRSDHITWINDLEKDSAYRSWPHSIQELLRPTYPGMLRHIAKNIFHVVFVVNPAADSSRELLKIAEALLVHQAPTKIGLVCVSPKQQLSEDKDPDASVMLCAAFYALCKDETPAKAVSFLTDVYERGPLSVESVKKEISRNLGHLDLDSLLTEHADELEGARKFLSSTGLSKAPQVLLNGVPITEANLAPDAFEEALVGDILRSTTDIQRAVYRGDIHDGTVLLDWLMEKDNVMPRLNQRILSSDRQFLSLHSQQESVTSFDKFSSLSDEDMLGSITSGMNYITRKDIPHTYTVSMWVVADIGSAAGRAVLYKSLKHLKHSHNVRVGVIHNPVQILGDTPTDYEVTRAVHMAITSLPSQQKRSFVPKLLKEENIGRLKRSEIELQDFASEGMDWEAFQSSLATSDISEMLKSHSLFAKRVLKLAPGEGAVIANGRLIGPLTESDSFEVEDFALLEKHTMSSFASRIKRSVAGLTDMQDRASELVLRLSPILAQKTRGARTSMRLSSTKHSVLELPARDPESAAFDIFAVIDPASTDAQRILPLVLVLQDVLNVNIRVALNPRPMLSEMPVKSFYAGVLEASPDFNSEGPRAQFLSLPQKVLLTLHIHAPESWMVSAVRTPHDLDNILLSEVQSGIRAEFALEHLLLEGHCYDSSGSPPRGLQFTLGHPGQTPEVDTIVMANLGYFQLKANPGVWELKLRDGRSKDIYNIIQHENTNSARQSPDVIVVMDSFKSRIIQIKVDKQPGKESQNVLQDDEADDDDGGLWNTISSSLTGSKSQKETATEDKDETLNIFSLASGHLYERLLRIMMLSVLKQTKSKVKFWFLRNYLSPSFKDFIPHMSREYGFEYELVHYKWPRWLNQQTEKQRIIWGYKILFLDVLFPLNVKKIIFVDADQIVRTDLQELYDLDLEGAPYGYTPFCDSRTDMDGFRFWKSGYWAGHLAGRKYHISALYVIDLKRFRRIAAGDRLRGQYQALSQDPNSLSNLDQDLPNNMIHQVPIKSLPQEWLWCETWCSDESKPAAKTIDLCNNPLTKEPKLVAAARILPEWTGYDQEVKNLWNKVYQRTSTGTEESSTEKPSKKSHEHTDL